MKAKIEAILYIKASPVPISELAEIAKITKEETEQAIIELMSDYGHRDSALEIVETDTGYCLQLKSPFQSILENLLPINLGIGTLRTLAAIALKGTITQTELIELRGSGAYQQVAELVELGYIKKQKQKEGRSFILQVTPKFHHDFELSELTELQNYSSPSEPASEEP